jgi:F-box protein 21
MVLIAEWCQPTLDIQEQKIQQDIDQIADQILQHLPAQAIQQISNKESDALDVVISREVLDAANSVFQAEGFAGNSEDYYSPDNSYINRVLATRRGIPITLSLLYSCVFARLGVACQPVNFPSHFLLRWQEHPQATTEQGRSELIVGNKNCFFIPYGLTLAQV